MKFGEYLVCKKEHQVGNSIILVGRKYKIVCIINRGLSINTYGEFEKLIYMKSDLIDIDIPGSAIYLSSFKNSSYTDLYIDDYFVDVSEVREEKLKELGI